MAASFSSIFRTAPQWHLPESIARKGRFSGSGWHRVDLLVAAQLGQSGFAKRGRLCARRMVRAALERRSTPILASAALPRSGSLLPQGDGVLLPSLRRVFAAGLFEMHRRERAARRSSNEMKIAGPEGFMRGSIHLVFAWRNRFHIVDCKLNFLGEIRPMTMRGRAAPCVHANASITFCSIISTPSRCIAIGRCGNPATSTKRTLAACITFSRGLGLGRNCRNGVFLPGPMKRP